MYRRTVCCALVLLLVPGVGACRRLAAYDAAPEPTSDLGPADAPPPTDTLPNLPPDQGPQLPDQGPKSPDLTSINDAGVCSEPSMVLIASACDTQRQDCTLGLAPDQDCDGLLDPLDPQKTACNPLELADDGRTAWTSTTSNGCTVRVEGGTASVGSARPNQRIWVMRFHTPSLLPQTGGGADKIVFAAQASPTPNYRSCGIQDGTTGTIRLHLVADINDGKKVTADSTKQITPLPAGDYELVVTADGGTHHCQLYDGQGKLLLNAMGTGGPTMPDKTYGITISALGTARIDVDYVRVYALLP